jgi:hypothetical protein
MSLELDPKLINIQPGSGWRKLPALGAGLAVLGLIIAGAALDTETMEGVRKFWTSYLHGLVVVMALAFGGAFFVVVQHVVRAGWSIVVRRIAENVALTLPILALFYLPILMGEAHHGSEEHGDEHAEEVAEAPARIPGTGEECDVEDHADLEASRSACSQAGLWCDPWKHSCQPEPPFLGSACNSDSDCAAGMVCQDGEAGKSCENHKPDLMPGHTHLYEWTHTNVVKNDEMLAAKAPYLNTGAAKMRYFGWFMPVWVFIGFLFWRWSVQQDKASDPEVYAHKQRRWSAFGVMMFALTISFSAFDYIMSLDPHWFSTMFGVYYFCGAVLSIFSFMALIFALLLRSGYLTNIVTPEHFHDIGKFMFGFTVFWTYISFSQYFLIWYANIPEETHWFDYRSHGDFWTLSLGLLFGRFIIPFFILLRRPLKRNPTQLAVVACWILMMEIYEMFWLVQPAYNHHLAEHFKGIGNYEAWHYYETHAEFGGTDVGMILCFIGIFLTIFGWALNKNALVPIRDPRLEESINHENF